MSEMPLERVKLASLSSALRKTALIFRENYELECIDLTLLHESKYELETKRLFGSSGSARQKGFWLSHGRASEAGGIG